ncbi:MAG: primosomal protein N' [Armatimonadota bacterium]|nr:primosomal protein N' [Armatimonadota bacterium]
MTSTADVLLLTGGPLAHQSLTYVVPKQLQQAVQPGAGVLVPLRSRLALGVVLQVNAIDTTELADRALKPIASVLNQPLLDAQLMRLLHLLSRTQLCALAEAARVVLPAPLRFRLRAVVELVEPVPALRSAAQRITAEALRRHGGRVSMNTLKRELATAIWQPGLRGLREKGCVRFTYELEPPPAPTRHEVYAELIAPPEALETFFATETARAPAQTALLTYLLEHPEGRVARTHLLETVGASLASWRALETRGLVRTTYAHTHLSPAPTPVPLLTQAQQYAVDVLREAISSGEYRAFLLYGVTGSGKTEVYLRAAAECVRHGRSVLVLVPEIALTAQLTQAFRERFGSSVAVLHSQLSPSERYAQWLRIKQGEAPLVIGARSAVFAPLPNVGLIVVDEEHETSYKHNGVPAYHARAVAEVRARDAKAVLLLGSATPALETFYRTEQGALQRLELPERIGGTPLPEVQLVDLRGKPFQVISPELHEALRATLAAGRQAILFLNRRGYAPMLLCRECGYTPKCPNCSVSLVYHRHATPFLLCHHCRHRQIPPATCPQCGGIQLRPFGVGTQRVEQTLRQLLPNARTARLDRDTFQRRDQYLRVLAEFRAGTIDVLIGTQMAARGLDFPRVALVGVISADTGLYVPDFRASERVFQLLTQVIGRAGRRTERGYALIQTYNPDHYAIQCALRQDYLAFYQQELLLRREVGYPPFTRLVNLLSTNTNPAVAERPLLHLASALASQVGDALVQVLGPAPAPLARLEARYRYHLLLKFAPEVEPAALLESALATLPIAERAQVRVDVDPISLM